MPRIVYLDLNFWIGLAQAHAYHPEGARYEPLLRPLSDGAQAGDIILPLSSAHYIETSRIKDPRQRRALAEVMIALTGHRTLNDRSRLLEHELRLALADEFDVSYDAPPPELLGFGCQHAFGESPLRPQIVGGTPEEHDRFIAEHGTEILRAVAAQMAYPFAHVLDASSVDALYDSALLVAEFALLAGPGDAYIPKLRELGYSPESSYAVIEDIRAREQLLANILKANSARRRKLADIVNARALIWDLSDALAQALQDLELTRDDIFDEGKPRFNRLLAAIPILVVESALRLGMFKAGSRVWETNDIYDIAHLGVAIPHCDIVATDKRCVALLRQAQIDSRFKCTLAPSPEELVAAL